MTNRRWRVLAGSLAAVAVLTVAGGSIVGAAPTEERQKTESGTDLDAELTKKEALKIAREEAGVKAKEIDHSKVDLDYDDGILSYDVEFYVGDKKYDYEIEANTGEILAKDFEIERDFLKEESSNKEEAKITKKEAKKIALEKVEGASDENIRVKLERDDGKLIYEGKILYDGTEYEFEINAKSGKIIGWESESEWDD